MGGKNLKKIFRKKFSEENVVQKIVELAQILTLFDKVSYKEMSEFYLNFYK